MLLPALIGAALAAPPPWPDAGLSLGSDGGGWVGLDAGWSADGVPPFAAAERDLAHLGVTGRWAIAEPVELRLRYEGLAGWWADGTMSWGSGDLRLGTAARPLAQSGARPALWLDWEMKLPNAPEDSGLGTDEADLAIRALARWEGGGWAGTAGAGLAILGDPRRYAAQDDAALLWLSGAKALGPVTVLGRVHGRLPSGRNPADLRAALGVEGGLAEGRLRLGAEGLGGLSPAAPTWGARAWVGWRVGAGG